MLAISYPHYLYLRDLIRPDVLLYFNMDDYRFYWMAHRETIYRLECQAVREADLSVICAGSRADALRADVPEAAERILHVPHGATALGNRRATARPSGAAPEAIAHLPRPFLGFVGSLEDRVDWDLVRRVAEAFPEGSVVLLGRPPERRSRGAWLESYRRAIAIKNVHVIGWRPQTVVSRYMAAFDVCLIPYRTDHPFNIASCPTKVMDYMATSRPS